MKHTRSLHRLGSFDGVVRGFAFSLFGAILGSVLLASSAFAGAEEKAPADSKALSPVTTAADVLGSRVSGLLQVEFSDKYLTPRGLEAHTNSAVVQPMVILFWDLWKKEKGSKSWLDDVTLITGVWNDVDFVGTPTERGANGANHDEIDPFGGLSFKFMKDWQFDALTTLFAGENGISQGDVNEDLKLTYHDHFFKDLLPGFSLNPYVEYWKTLNKYSATVFGEHHSYYGVIGADPTYNFADIPLTVELPTNINLTPDGFYKHPNGDAGGAGVALFTTEIKLSTPLTFIPVSLGAWKAYAGFQYYYIFNKGLIDTNQAINNASTKDNDLYQLHAGISCFF